MRPLLMLALCLACACQSRDGLDVVQPAAIASGLESCTGKAQGEPCGPCAQCDDAGACTQTPADDDACSPPTFTSVNLGATNLSAAWARSPSEIYVVGTSGKFLLYDGVNTPASTCTVPGTVGLNDVSGAAGSPLVFAVGSAGNIWRHDDNGCVQVAGCTGRALQAVFLASATSGMTVGDRAACRFDGSGWTTTNPPWTGFATDVWGDGSVWYAVAETLYKYESGSWSTVTLPDVPTSFGGVWGSSASDVFVVGNRFNGSSPNGFDTIINHWNGSAWTAQPNAAHGSVVRIAGTSPTNVLVSTYYPGLWARYDGATWSEFDPGVNATWIHVTPLDRAHFFALNGGGGAYLGAPAPLDCDELDETCRDHHDLSANRCASLGVCKEANTVSGCTSFTNASDDTACESDSNECTADVCRSGGCAHENVQDDTPCTADSNDCTRDVCLGGACDHPAIPDGDPCGVCKRCDIGACVDSPATTPCDDVLACTHTDLCDGNGGCTGTAFSCDGSSRLECEEVIGPYPGYTYSAQVTPEAAFHCNLAACPPDGLGFTTFSFAVQSTGDAVQAVDVRLNLTHGDWSTVVFEVGNASGRGQYVVDLTGSGSLEQTFTVGLDGPASVDGLWHISIWDTASDNLNGVLHSATVSFEARTPCDGAGACDYIPRAPASFCDDGNACTSNDRCDNNVQCAGTAYTCTLGTCEASSTCDGAGGCIPMLKNEGEVCDDNNTCSIGEQCNAFGQCVASTVTTCQPQECQTASACAGDGGCIATPEANGTACSSDQNPCTVDECLDGECVHTDADTSVTCDDGEACTASDHCDGIGGCTGTLHACAPAECEETSVCDGLGGCVVTAKTDGTACTSDGDMCTVDQCVNGQCQHARDAACGADAGGGDAGVAPDAGAADAGRDAGHDAGARVDAGRTNAPDAAVAVVPDAGAGGDAGGECNCNQSSNEPAFAVSALVLAAWWLAGRRRR